MKVPGQVDNPSAISTSQADFPSDGASLRAYLARPSHKNPRGAIIVIPEAFGLNDHIRDLARRFANAGFDALAIDVYTRTGAPDPEDMASVMSKMLALPDAQVVRDLEAGAAYLRALPNSNGRVACIGFCSGGRQTLLFACSSRKVDAAIDCWGGFVTRASPDAETTPQRPVPVIKLIPQLACPVLFANGAEDTNPSPEVVAQVEAAVKAAGKTATFKMFAGAGHAFLADYRPSYREKQAFELWPQIIGFLTTHIAKAP